MCLHDPVVVSETGNFRLLEGKLFPGVGKSILERVELELGEDLRPRNSLFGVFLVVG